MAVAVELVFLTVFPSESTIAPVLVKYVPLFRLIGANVVTGAAVVVGAGVVVSVAMPTAVVVGAGVVVTVLTPK